VEQQLWAMGGYALSRQVPKFAGQNSLHGTIIFSSVILVLTFSSILFGMPKDAEPNVPGEIAFYLPPVIFAVPDIETSIYFDNICLVVNPSNYVFDVNCDKGIQQSERWTFLPTSKDIGLYSLVIEVRDEINRIIARSGTMIKVVPKDAGAYQKRTILMIGDSLTQYSIYPRHLLDLCKGDTNPTITLIGSHVPDSNCPFNRHEGYGGWTAKAFATRYTGIARIGDYRKRGSPFLYQDVNEEPKFNFGRYCVEFNNGKKPDFVTILLGANDIFYANDGSIDRIIDEMLAHYDKLIKMLHGFHSDTKIGVLLPLPPAASQDAFGVNYGCGQSRWQYKRNQHHLVKRLIDHYGNREIENVFIVGTNVAIDCVHGYPPNNALHPSEYGYYQIGDVIYSWIKAILDSKS